MPISDEAPALSRHRRGGRVYPFPPETPAVAKDFVAVSSILKHKSKDAIPYWAAKQVATYAFDCRDEWERLPRPRALKILKGIPWDSLRGRADLGTAVHTAIQYYFKDGMSLSDAIGGAVGDDQELRALNLERYVVPGLEFVENFVDEILYQECTLYNPVEGYAGTADMVARMKTDGVLAVLDWKTGSGVYDETGFQLTAYVACTELAEMDYGTGRIVRCRAPEFTHGGVVHLTGDHGYTFYTIPFREEMFEAFLGLKKVWEWVNCDLEWYSNKIKSVAKDTTDDDDGGVPVGAVGVLEDIPVVPRPVGSGV